MYDQMLKEKIRLEKKLQTLKPSETDFIENTPIARQYRRIKTDLGFNSDYMAQLRNS